MMGYRIKEIRESKGMTQTELSQKAGVARATIWKLETDESAVTMSDTLMRIANALGVTVKELFFDDEV